MNSPIKTSPLVLESPFLPGLCPITEAINELAQASDSDERGAVFTRREVVEFILDLVGYTPDERLSEKKILEPSFGQGDFIIPVIERLLKSVKIAAQNGYAVASLDNAIRAVELHEASYKHTRQKVIALLCASGYEDEEAKRIAKLWLVQGDFLLTGFSCTFDWVIGNPPYVRQELIPAPLLLEYRRRYATLYDRADLYIPFIERALELLSDGGKLSFICSDRWMKNRYGGPLRALIARGYHLSAYVDMVDTPAFLSEVTAYPAITVMEKAPPGPTSVAARPRIDGDYLTNLARSLRSGKACCVTGVHRLEQVAIGDAPWILGISDTTDLVRRLESAFPTIEEAGCKVGIGVATGADRVYIGKFADLDVEDDRKVPLAMTRDIVSGRVEWRGFAVINPFVETGGLVDLAEYPRLRAYLERNRGIITERHVAKKDSVRWYRTIDRITPSLALRPKLLIPDIKGEAQVVYEEGKLYPHHNLYYIISEDWDLHALQAVLLSKLTRFFVATYCTTMRGGFLRFQAQYLRRIRVPKWEDVGVEMRDRLVRAAKTLNLVDCNAAVGELYNLTPQELAILEAS